MSSFVILDEAYVWFDDVDITPYLRTGRDRLAVVDGRIVFAVSGRSWSPARPGGTGIVIDGEVGR